MIAETIEVEEATNTNPNAHQLMCRMGGMRADEVEALRLIESRHTNVLQHPLVLSDSHDVQLWRQGHYVVAILKELAGPVVRVAVAKFNPEDDRFDPSIGRMIALRRLAIDPMLYEERW